MTNNIAKRLRTSADQHAELGMSDLIVKAREAADELDRLMAEARSESECWASAQRWHEKYKEAQAEIEQLMEAIWRIDGINDNMACYNPDINAVTDPILRPEPKP